MDRAKSFLRLWTSPTWWQYLTMEPARDDVSRWTAFWCRYRGHSDKTDSQGRCTICGDFCEAKTNIPYN